MKNNDFFVRKNTKKHPRNFAKSLLFTIFTYDLKGIAPPINQLIFNLNRFIMEKNETAASQAATGENTPQNEASSKTIKLPKAIKEKSDIDLLREKLQAELDRLNKKSTIAQQRENFINTREKIKSFAAEVKKDEKDDFNNENSRLVLSAGRYRNDNVVSVSSCFVLIKFCEFIDKEIGDKITSLEANLLED